MKKTFEMYLQMMLIDVNDDVENVYDVFDICDDYIIKNSDNHLIVDMILKLMFQYDIECMHDDQYTFDVAKTIHFLLNDPLMIDYTKIIELSHQHQIDYDHVFELMTYSLKSYYDQMHVC